MIRPLYFMVWPDGKTETGKTIVKPKVPPKEKAFYIAYGITDQTTLQTIAKRVFNQGLPISKNTCVFTLEEDSIQGANNVQDEDFLVSLNLYTQYYSTYYDKMFFPSGFLIVAFKIMVPTSELGAKYARLDHTTYFSRLDVTIKSKDVIYATIYEGMTIKLNMGNPQATIE